MEECWEEMSGRKYEENGNVKCMDRSSTCKINMNQCKEIKPSTVSSNVSLQCLIFRLIN